MAARLTLQTMNLPFFSASMSPESLSSLRWNEIVELNFSQPVTWQQTSPTVAPRIGCTSPESSSATGQHRWQRNSKIERLVGSPRARNIVVTSNSLTSSIYHENSRYLDM